MIYLHLASEKLDLILILMISQRQLAPTEPYVKFLLTLTATKND